MDAMGKARLSKMKQLFGDATDARSSSVQICFMVSRTIRPVHPCTDEPSEA